MLIRGTLERSQRFATFGSAKGWRLGPEQSPEADRAGNDGPRRGHASPEPEPRAADGVFTDKPGTLTNDSFGSPLDVGTAWRPSPSDTGVYEGAAAWNKVMNLDRCDLLGKTRRGRKPAAAQGGPWSSPCGRDNTLAIHRWNLALGRIAAVARVSLSAYS